MRYRWSKRRRKGFKNCRRSWSLFSKLKTMSSESPSSARKGTLLLLQSTKLLCFLFLNWVLFLCYSGCSSQSHRRRSYSQAIQIQGISFQLFSLMGMSYFSKFLTKIGNWIPFACFTFSFSKNKQKKTFGGSYALFVTNSSL